jgi:hypothetical protein
MIKHDYDLMKSDIESQTLYEGLLDSFERYKNRHIPFNRKKLLLVC